MIILIKSKPHPPTHNNMTDFWKIDTETYTEIQKLTRFVDFVKSLNIATEKDIANCENIKRQIINLVNTEKLKSWNICIDIFDYEVQAKIDDAKGYYWKTWAVFFEGGHLTIEAKSEHTNETIGHYGNDFHFNASVNFKKDINFQRIYLDNDIDLFVNDAIKYESYIKGGLKDVEIDVDI